MTATVAIGFGCSSQANCDDLLALIQACAPERPAAAVLATLDRRAAIGEQLSRALDLPLVLFSAPTLAAVPGTSETSSAALSTTGTPSVAEASALAALGPKARLLVPRKTGRFCTCAVAVRA